MTGTGLCIGHDGGQRCQKPGYNKCVESRTVDCKAHEGERRCQHLDCTKSEGRTEYCIMHDGVETHRGVVKPLGANRNGVVHDLAADDLLLNQVDCWRGERSCEPPEDGMRGWPVRCVKSRGESGYRTSKIVDGFGGQTRIIDKVNCGGWSPLLEKVVVVADVKRRSV
ncbi:hypothetical protein L2E82_32047 [Cichorium intybus]|uniref:Uncharacterized protein n=1 Tax=Cichorium intybus TaxID=13427 RepID=A0ACB9BGI6_CICIN|nr:hypothetical protein L2E82_32047 [Cichorium intybus]